MAKARHLLRSAESTTALSARLVGPPAEIDMNGDFNTDFKVGYDGFASSNWRKPFVDTRTIPGSAALTQSDSGVPITPFGTMIDATYLAPSPTQKAYLSKTATAPSSVTGPNRQHRRLRRVELFDTNSVPAVTNFGWIHLIYSATVANPPVLTLVDWAYETTPRGHSDGINRDARAPKMYAAPPSQTVPTGAKVEMKVLALGQPSPAYQWRAGQWRRNLYQRHKCATSPGHICDSHDRWRYAANVADYVVVITNPWRAYLQSPATLSSARR